MGYVDTYGTGTKSDDEILAVVKKNFDLRPGCIVRDLELRKPIFRSTAKYGHFGRPTPGRPPRLSRCKLARVAGTSLGRYWLRGAIGDCLPRRRRTQACAPSHITLVKCT